MASMRDIKRRKTSISSTQQITKAMKLVSTVKLKKPRIRQKKRHLTSGICIRQCVPCWQGREYRSSLFAGERVGSRNHCDHIQPWSCRRLQFQYHPSDPGSDINWRAQRYTQWGARGRRLWRAKAITWSPTIRMSWRLLLMRMRRRSVRKS